MTKRAGQVAFQNVCRELFAFPVSNAIDEIAEIAAGRDMVIDLDARFALLLALGKEFAVLDDASFEVELVGYLERQVPLDHRNLGVRDQASGCKQQQRVAIVEH